MKLEFFKYQATGNDFIMVDNRQKVFPKTDTDYVRRLCHRRFGIGADGLILLEEEDSSDFRMIYFNADGKEGSMCGNGGRSIVAFAKRMGIIDRKAHFLAIDGPHEAEIKGDLISLKMGDVDQIRSKPECFFLNTGSPHHVQMVEELDSLDVRTEGARLRYGLYGKVGSNINFVQPEEEGYRVRTYERGVEDETYSCGTGVTAVALAMHRAGRTQNQQVQIKTLGGDLNVRYRPAGESYTDIWLTGPAEFVFKGVLE